MLGESTAARRPARRLQRELGRWSRRPRAVETARRDRHDHELRVDRPQRIDIDRALDEQHIRDMHQRAVVANDRPLRRVEVLEQPARPPLPHGVATRRLDLDDVGAGVSEQLARVRTRDPRGAVDDAHVIQH